MAHSDDPTVPLTAMRVMRRVRSDPPDPSQIVGSEMNPTAKTVERPQYVTEKHLAYLDNLRETGVTNWSAPPGIQT